MKGRWVSDLAIRTIERDVTVQEAIRFSAARFLPKPTNFSLEGIQFRDAEHNIWAIVREIFLARRYSPNSDLLPKIRRIAMEVHFQTPGADYEGLYTFLKTFYRNIRIVKESAALGYLYAS